MIHTGSISYLEVEIVNLIFHQLYALKHLAT